MYEKRYEQYYIFYTCENNNKNSFVNKNEFTYLRNYLTFMFH